jgi:hypothetical protein
MIAEYWQVLTRRHFTTIVMPWNVIDYCSQMMLEIVRNTCWDLLNNIDLTYRSPNMHLTFFLKLNKYLHGIKRMFSINKNNENLFLITLHV